MRIVVLDSTAIPGVTRGPGSPAYFSRYVIEHLRSLGHDVTIEAAFDERACAEADAVWTEWCNEEAYEAAASGVCKRLVVRMRGYDVWGPLAKLQWDNVDALVYESLFLKALAEETHPMLKSLTNTCVLPSGIDLASIPFRPRKHGPVVAMVGRAVADKGYQLAFEWARQRPDIQLHVAMALRETNPRLVRYLEHTKPSNVTLYDTVDTVKWLDEINANYLLSASNWETLGYTIAEAMAMGIKPLVHDTPGAKENWELVVHTWRDFADLNSHAHSASAYFPREYRAFVHHNLDAAKLSPRFAELVLAPATRDTSKQRALLSRQHYEHANTVFTILRNAIDHRSNMGAIDALVSDFRARLEPHSLTSSHRYGSALATAVAYYNHSDLAQSEVWALRAMLDYARPDAFALLGDVAEGREDVEEAVQWYKAACAVDDTPNRYRFPDLVNGRHHRLRELEQACVVELLPDEAPETLIVIVTVRNGEKWIERCLKSILAQTYPGFQCYVVDDVSTDRTREIVEKELYRDGRIHLIRNTVRKWQARNTVEVARQVAPFPEDVVVLIDGDDWLSNDIAFTHLRVAYARGAWMTYGQLVESDGHPTRFGVYPKRIAESGRFADWPWCATPPRSFKRFLLDELTDDDFKIDGEWPKVSGDICVILPMLQLACEHAVGITVPIYAYNVETDDSDHKTDPYEQTRMRDLFLARPQKKRLVR